MDDELLRRRFGERLAQAREALGYSQAEFARLHGLDKGRLSHWEKGRHLPPAWFIQLLWDRHNITADWLYLGRIGTLSADLAASLPKVAAASEASSQ